jgi:enoyl-CoA hydratase/carnithine racemase
MTDSVLFEKSEKVGWLTLNRPESRNALSLEVIGEIQARLDRISQDPTVRVLVIRGNGPAFCAGHNLKEFSDPQNNLTHLQTIFAACTEMMLTIQKIPQPVIAQVHGIATAAGCQLVAACDLAVAEAGAQFSTPGVKIGLFCSTPMVPLVRVIGRRRALEMLLSGRYISTEEAEKFGLVNRVVPSEALGEETGKWASELAELSLRTLGFGKQVFYDQIDQDEKSAYAYAQKAIVLNALDEDAREGISAFLEKRKPVWKG